MTTSPAALAGRFEGALLGQCLGDALGFAVEGQPTELCALYVEALRRGDEPRGRGHFAFGQYTDDSQLARELALSLVVCGGFSPDDYGRRIASLFVEKRVVGRGQATTEAAERLAAGVPWERAGAPPPRAGNGSAMRVAPVGLFFHDDDDALRRAAVAQGEGTHRDPRCAAGCVAVAGAVARGMRDDEIDASRFAEELAALVEPVDAESAGHLRQLPGFLALEPEQALPAIAPLGKSAPDGWPGISPFVVGTVLWSLYSFLRSPASYLDAVWTAIAAGGDADTTAAITGAVAGAHVGRGGLPARWTRSLTDRGDWGEAELLRLAADLHAASMRRSGA